MPTFPAGSRLIAEKLDPSRVVATRVTTQSIANSSVTPVSFTGEEIDVGGLFTPTSTDIVVNVAGTWMTAGGLVYAANATGIRACLAQVNSVHQDGSSSLPAVGSAADFARMVAAFMKELAVSDVLRLSAFQTSGGALNVNSARLGTYLIARA